MKKRQRAMSAERGSLVSACGLLGLSAFKGAAGWITGSKALLADACHSAADSASAFTSYLSWRNARQKTSSSHAAAIASTVFSAILFVAGLEMGIHSAGALAAGPDEAPGWGAAAAIAVGMLIREALIRYKRRRDTRLGIRTDRPGEHRSDIFASLTALVGTSGAAAGAVLEMPVLFVLDPAAGLVISVFVLRMGYRMIYDVIRQTEHPVPPEMETQVLREAMQCIDGVVEVAQIHAKEQGHYLIVSAVIRVNPSISVAEGHNIAMRVRRHLMHRFVHVSDAEVQVQPYDPGYPYKSNHRDEEWSTLLQ